MKKVVILSKRVFDKTMRDNNINIDNVEVRDKVAFISINDTTNPHIHPNNTVMRILKNIKNEREA